MNLSLKAITLLFCCVMMTLQYRAQQRRHAASAASSADEQQPPSSASTAFSSLFSSTSGPPSPTLYQRLSVSTDATAEQIRTAHRRMAMRYHPDKLLAAHCTAAGSGGASDGSTHDMFIAIQEAYEVLSDPYERKRYDYTLITGMTYTRLSSALRNVHGRADKQQQQQQQEQDMATFPAYIRRRPAAFTSTAHSNQFHDNNRSATRSSSSSSNSNSSTASTCSSSSTPQPVRASKSFSSIFGSPFVHVSPAPSTASASGTGSPPYHSPASSPSTPASPISSFSFLSSPSTTPSAPTTAAAASRSTATSAENVGKLPSVLAVLLTEAQSVAVSLFRWMTVRLLMFILWPMRVALAIAGMLKQRRRRMEEQQRRMEEDEQAHRRRVHDEASVGMYGWQPAADELH